MKARHRIVACECCWSPLQLIGGILPLLFLLGCAGQDEIPLYVQIEGVPPLAARIKLQVALNQISDPEIHYVEQNLDRVVIYVPAGASGEIRIDATAEDSVRCTVGRGSGVKVLEGGSTFASTTLQLWTTEGRTCELSLTLSGEGQVRSEPKGLECNGPGRCSHEFPYGIAVKLKASWGGRTYGIGWSGACTGEDPECSLTLDRSLSGSASFGGRLCDQEWCWYGPTPWGAFSLNDIGSGDGKTVWAVGKNGLILHGDGLTWTPVVTECRADLSAFWADRTGLLWAVGAEGTVLRFDGSTWHSLSIGSAENLLSVWGSNPDDVWIGSATQFYHWDGRELRPVRSQAPQIRKIWGSRADDVWAAAIGSDYLLHWNGVQWSAVATGISRRVFGLWGSSTTDVWVVGEAGTILHWDGQKLSPITSGTTANLTAVWGTGRDDVWAMGEVVLHWNGTVWSPANGDFPKGIASMYSDARLGTWFVGGENVILRLGADGLRSLHAVELAHLAGVWGSSPNDVWAVGGAETILHWNGTHWQRVQGKNQSSGLVLQGVWGSSSKDAWAVGQGGRTLHWDGDRWWPVESGTTRDLYTVWGRSRQEVWVAGSGTVLRGNGLSWSNMSTFPGTGDAITFIAGAGTNKIWFGGLMGQAYRWDGLTWSSTRTAGSVETTLVAMGELAGGETWALDGKDSRRWIGGGGFYDVFIVPRTFYKWNGSTWSALTTDTRSWVGIHGTWHQGIENIWAACYNSVVLHYDGMTWTGIELSRGGDNHVLMSVWGTGTGELWVVGIKGALLRRLPPDVP